MSEPKKRRPFLRAITVVIVLIALLVVAAPTVLSWGPAAGIARGAIADSVNGDVQLKSVRLGWFSPQSVEGLTIKDTSGANVVDLNVTVHGGLLSLITSGGDGLEATVSGGVKGTIEPDGTNGLAKLFEKGTVSASSSSSGSAPAQGASQPVRATLNVNDFAVRLTDQASGHSYALEKLHGSASFDSAAGTFSTKIDGNTDFLGGKGTVALDADVTNLVGVFDPAAIGVDVALDGTNIRVPVDTRSADFPVVRLAIKSPRLGESVALTAKAEGSLDGSTSSSLVADVTVDRPFGAGGVLAGPAELLAGVKGSVVAAQLPTSLAQPMLAATSIDLPEDIGPTIELLEVNAPGGGGEPVKVEFRSAKASLAGKAIVGPDGAIRDAELSGTVAASPATLARLAGTTVGDTARVSLSGKGISWSPPANGASPLSTFVGEVGAASASPVSWTAPDGRYSVALGSDGRVTLGRAGLGDPFRARVSLAVGLGGARGATAPETSNVTASATLSDRLDRVSDASAVVDLQLDPAFLEGVARRTFPSPVPLRVELKDLDAPLPAGGTAMGAEGLSVDLVATIAGEHGLYVEELSRDIRFANITATLKSADAAKGGALSFVGQVDRGTVDVRQSIGPLPKDLARLEPLAIDTRGSVTLSGIDGDALVPWLPERRALIEAAAIRGLTVDLQNEPLAGKIGQRVAAKLSGQPLSGNVVASVEPTSARIETLALEGIVGKDLVAALQSSSETKLRMAEDVRFTLALEAPVTATFDELKAGSLPKGLAARVRVPQAIVSSAPGLASAVALRDFEATVAVESGGTAATTKGSFAAAGTTSPSDRIEKGTFDLAWSEAQGPSLLKGLSGDVLLAGISVPWVETLLGRESGSFSTWTGDTGDLALTMAASGQGESIRLTPKFPRVDGTLDVLTKGESVEARTNGLAVRVDADALTKLAMKPTAEASRQARYSFTDGLVAQVTSGTVRLPKALAGEGLSLAGGSVDVALETQALSIGVETPGKAPASLEMPGVTAKANASNLGEALTFSVSDRGGGTPGANASIRVEGTARKLLNAAGALDASSALVDLDASVKDLPSIFVDLVAATGGTVTRTLGERLDATAKATGLSKSSGQLSAKLVAPYAEFDAPSITIADGAMTVTQAKPITANFELSPGMKNQILYVINPVFADIDVADKRATFSMPALSYPLDGSFAKLNGSFRLDIGDLKFKNGAPLSTVMTLFKDKPDNLEGRIEPLVVNVANGILTYKDFALRFGRTQSGWKTVANMDGSIDLTKTPQYVNGITTSLPASQIGNFSSDVRTFFDSIGGADSELAKTLAIGITMYGPLYDAAGKRVPLERRVALPKLEDVLKDPGNLLKEGLKIFDGIRKDKEPK